MTNTTGTSTDEEIDPRLAAISQVLQNQQDKWVTIHEGEVIFDTLVAAAIVAFTMDELNGDNVSYCNAQCHEDEYEYFTHFIRTFDKDCTNPYQSCSDKIIKAIEGEEANAGTKTASDGTSDKEDS
jgi:ferredoxin-fold anticodon binding domain-containing protein